MHCSALDVIDILPTVKSLKSTCPHNVMQQSTCPHNVMQPVQTCFGNSFCGCIFHACVKLFPDPPMESSEKDEHAYQLHIILTPKRHPT